MITAMPELVSAKCEHPKAVRNGYTELQVLHSAAGFYIGTLYEEYDANGKCVWQEPGSRDSDYFRTEESAEAYLKILNAGTDDDAAAVLRQHP